MQTCPAPSIWGARRLSRRIQSSLFVLGALGLVIIASPGRAATLLEYWNFDNDVSTFGSSLGTLYNTNSTTTPNGSGEIYNTGTKTITGNSSTSVGAVYTGSIDMSNVVVGTNPSNGSPYANGNSAPAGSVQAWGLYSNSSLHDEVASDTVTHQGSLIVFGSNAASDSVIFTLSSAGYAGLTLTLDGRYGSSAANNPTVSWSYSLDGTNWTLFSMSLTSGSAAAGSWGSYSSGTLSSTLDNLSTFYIKEQLVFPTSTVGSLAIDTVALTATNAVPEPSTVALIGLGGAVAFWRLRRRAAALS